jgi:hypothetical protein
MSLELQLLQSCFVEEAQNKGRSGIRNPSGAEARTPQYGEGFGDFPSNAQSALAFPGVSAKTEIVEGDPS